MDTQGSANTVSTVMNFSVAAGPAPVISNPLPVGVQPYSTTQVTLRVSTNEAATCRYHTSDVVYSSMSNTFASTGGTTHQITGFAVSNGKSYSLFVRCINGGGFASTDSRVIGFSVATSPQGATPAFIGAAGGGATSVGGRGSMVYEVTNLNDAGPGSLREGINMPGPRTIVFRVGGMIRLYSSLKITNPYITIAGQTAPGGGILLSGEYLTPPVPGAQNMLIIETSDVILRFVRFRLSLSGGDPCPGDNEDCRADNITIKPSASGVGARNIILDHVSASWGTDENMGVASRSTSALLTDLTISWSLIGEGLLPHSMGILLAGSNEMDALTTGIDLHHNFFTSNQERNPQMRLGEGSFINNIVYLWKGGGGTHFFGGTTFDIIGNIYKQGPGTDDNDILFSPDCADPIYIQGTPSVYIAGNLGVHQSDVEVDNWPFIQGRASDPTCNPTGTSNHYVLPESHKRTTPLQSINPRAYPITVHHVFNDSLEDLILNNVGASKRLDCLGNWISNRDGVDQRLVTQFLNNTGIIPTSVSEVGGFPILASGTACTDTDHDGMPDQWETAKGLNPNNASDGPTIHTSGYSHLERYLNGESATTTSCNTVTTSNFSQSTYNAYGAPYDAFQTSTNLMNARCNSADTHTINLTTGVTGDTTRIVYTKGYWYDAVTTSWRQYIGTCTGALNGEWCQGSVSATITDPNVSTASAGAPTYLVGMTCSIQGGSWKCGCRDTTCANFSWQIQGAGM